MKTIQNIRPLDTKAMAAAEARQGCLTKPPQALGRLESLSIHLAGITGKARPTFEQKVIAVMAGDHGVVAEGVSAFPAEVTPQMVYNFLAGGAAINVLGRHVGARVVVTDVGVASDLSGAVGVRHKNVRQGTANMAVGPAMTRNEAIRAFEVGIELVEEELANGLDLIATGEMGIGNTTPSSAIIAAFTGLPVARVTGRGTGISEEALDLKIQVIERALAVTFLTRLPLPTKGEIASKDLRASMGWYPLVGLALGAVGFGGYTACRWFFPATVSAALVIIMLELCSGALHLDGLMDTCDGVGSGKPRERMLEIMKDSRVGAMGVFGAVAVILIKVTALAALIPQQSLLPLLGGWAAARAVPVLDVAIFRYAREFGTGGLFAGDMPFWVVLLTMITTATIGWLAGKAPGMLLLFSAIAITLLVQAGISHKLGGLTGDVYGFGVELTEALVLIGGCALATWKFI